MAPLLFNICPDLQAIKASIHWHGASVAVSTPRFFENVLIGVLLIALGEGSHVIFSCHDTVVHVRYLGVPVPLL